MNIITRRIPVLTPPFFYPLCSNFMLVFPTTTIRCFQATVNVACHMNSLSRVSDVFLKFPSCLVCCDSPHVRVPRWPRVNITPCGAHVLSGTCVRTIHSPSKGLSCICCLSNKLETACILQYGTCWSWSLMSVLAELQRAFERHLLQCNWAEEVHISVQGRNK